MNPIHLARIGALLKLPHLLTICFSSPKTTLVSCLCMYRKLFFMLSVLWIVNSLAPGVKWISFDSGQHPEGSESICFITCQSLKTHTETMAAQNCNLRLIVVLKQSHAQQIIQQTPVSLAHNVVIREASVSISGPFQSLSLCSYSKPVSLSLSLLAHPCPLPRPLSVRRACCCGITVWTWAQWQESWYCQDLWRVRASHLISQRESEIGGEKAGAYFSNVRNDTGRCLMGPRELRGYSVSFHCFNDERPPQRPYHWAGHDESASTPLSWLFPGHKVDRWHCTGADGARPSLGKHCSDTDAVSSSVRPRSRHNIVRVKRNGCLSLWHVGHAVVMFSSAAYVLTQGMLFVSSPLSQ